MGDTTRSSHCCFMTTPCRVPYSQWSQPFYPYSQLPYCDTQISSYFPAGILDRRVPYNRPNHASLATIFSPAMYNKEMGLCRKTTTQPHRTNCMYILFLDVRQFEPVSLAFVFYLQPKTQQQCHESQ